MQAFRIFYKLQGNISRKYLGSADKLLKIFNESGKSLQNQGASVGMYILTAAINRAVSPSSTNGMKEWYEKASLFTDRSDMSDYEIISASSDVITHVNFHPILKGKPEAAFMMIGEF